MESIVEPIKFLKIRPDLSLFLKEQHGTLPVERVSLSCSRFQNFKKKREIDTVLAHL